MSEPDKKSLGSWQAFLLIALSGVLYLVQSYFTLLSLDEIYVLQTDSVHRLSELVQIQIHYPVSLDPFFYHLLVHYCCVIFGGNTFAVRLPSLVGFMTLQYCLYIAVQRIAGERAGLIAIAIPALTSTVYYAIDARPYGLMLGLVGVLLVSWQSAIAASATTQPLLNSRRAALCGIALALGLLLNTHYYAVLILVPLYGAELFRSIKRRAVDLPVAISILLGTACGAFVLPFTHAAREFQANYYNGGNVSLGFIPQAYIAMLHAFPATKLSPLLHIASRLPLGFLWIGCIFLVIRGFYRYSALGNSAQYLYLFLCLLAFLPVFGYVLARFVTHSVEARFVSPALISLAIVLAIALGGMGRGQRLDLVVPWFLALVMTLQSLAIVDREYHYATPRLASFRLSSSVRQAMLQTPSKRIYFNNLGRFEMASYYEPDQDLRANMTLVYSRDLELANYHEDTNSRSSIHLKQFANIDVVSYEDFLHSPGPYVVITDHIQDGGPLADPAWSFRSVRVEPIGPAFMGEAFLVSDSLMSGH
jgi:hypothetical protein